MASTKTMQSQVNSTNTIKTKKPFRNNYVLFPKGPRRNIFNREEGMPKPPRVEKIRSRQHGHDDNGRLEHSGVGEMKTNHVQAPPGKISTNYKVQSV